MSEVPLHGDVRVHQFGSRISARGIRHVFKAHRLLYHSTLGLRVGTLRSTR